MAPNLSCFSLRSDTHSSASSFSARGTRAAFDSRRLTWSSANLRASDSLKQASVPSEDLTASKRRLVCIRRQPDSAPVALQVGFKSRTGWQPLSNTRDNQDVLAVILPLPDPLHPVSLFAVYDGHGRGGHKVAGYVAENVVVLFTGFLEGGGLSVDAALRKAFLRTNKALMAQRVLDVCMTGCTASVAVVYGRRLLCANVGDSRVVVGRRRKNGEGVEPLVLTTDHVPDHPIERERIERSGGRVEKWAPGGLDTGGERVWLKDKRVPGLSVSRVFGDSIVEGIVSAEPEMTTHMLEQGDLFIVVATDGIWGVMSNEEVVEFVEACGEGQTCQKVAELLVKKAATLWFEAAGETIDDISVVLVRLKL